MMAVDQSDGGDARSVSRTDRLVSTLLIGGKIFLTKYTIFIENILSKLFSGNDYMDNLDVLSSSTEALPESRKQQCGTTPAIKRVADSPRSLYAMAKAELLNLIEALKPGDSLPTYPELAARMNCSVAPVKQAMRELQQEGRISLQRGRPAKVLWNNSFSRSARRTGHQITTRAFELSYRRLEAGEQGIESELGLESGGECIVCGRVRIVDNRPVALQVAYINPVFFREPQRFFLEHDVVSGSLSEVYAGLGFRPLSVTAKLRVGQADERERRVLSLSEATPVLRSHQWTVVDRNGKAEVLEVMNATYTQDIEFTVERLPKWNQWEIGNV